MQSFNFFPWFMWIPIVAIVGGCIDGIIKQLCKHRERMAMIRAGMHPDGPEAADYEAQGRAVLGQPKAQFPEL